MRHFRINILMLCFVVGILCCAAKEAQLKTGPEGTSTQQVSNSKEEIAVPATSQSAPAAPAGAQPPPPSQPSKTAEAQEPTSPPAPSAQPPVPATPQPPTPASVEPLSVQPSKPAGAQPLTPPPAPSARPPVPSPPQSPTPAGVQPPAPSQPGAPPVARPAMPATGPGVIFNFDNADIYEVIRVMTEILKINYLIDPRVKGTVNIHTTGQLPAEEIFPIFQAILRLNGATAVKKDGLYEIVPLSDAKKTYVSPTTIRGGTKLPFEEKYTIQIVSLKYIPATEASKLIKPFLSDGADIVEHPPHNILIISDVASNIKKSLDILALFDIDIFTGMRVRIYPILNADVTEVAKEMERIFSSFEVSTKSARGVGITFTPITRINSLLVVSSIPNIFEKVEGWLRELDKIPGEGSKLSVFVYYVQNAKAKDLAEVLKEVFVKGKEKKTEKAGTPAETTPRGARPAPTPATPPTSAKEEAGGVPEGEINIVVDETTNSLVIKAFHRDYRAILETIKKLDIYPKQVLIEVFLAEVTLDEANKFGIEWAKFVSSKVTDSQAQGAVAGSQPPADPFSAALPQGIFFRYAIVELGGRLSAAINLAASQDRLKVISSPHIIASNNKEAKIQVGSSQPILTSTYSYGSAATSGTVVTPSTAPATGVIEGSIEYKDIGIILSVTPRISDGGLVSMEISIENSTVNASAIPLGNLQNVPVFGKKTAKTILSVMEGQTIVLGGLIADSKEKITSGIPLLSKIPIIGALFGFQTYEKKRDELILLMTPHIISDQFKSDDVTREFKEKVEGMRKQLEEKEKKEKERKEKKEK
jgi:general secretion pathway protein D